MKQRIKFVANDGDTKLTITALIDHTGALCKSEQQAVKKSLIRKLAEMAPEIRWTDYGIDNIKIR